MYNQTRNMHTTIIILFTILFIISTHANFGFMPPSPIVYNDEYVRISTIHYYNLPPKLQQLFIKQQATNMFGFLKYDTHPWISKTKMNTDIFTQISNFLIV